MEKWYLAIHKLGKGNAIKAQFFLSQIGITAFIPQICNLQPRGDRPGQYRKVIEPLFPGYLFVLFDYETHQIKKVENCPGISKLVRFGGVLKPLHDSIVDEVLRLTMTIGDDVNLRDDAKNLTNVIDCSHNNVAVKLCEKVKEIASEMDGVNRSALFYSFIDAIKDRH